MAGPWEKYQQAAPEQTGPWAKYQAAPAVEAPAPAPDTRPGFVKGAEALASQGMPAAAAIPKLHNLIKTGTLERNLGEYVAGFNASLAEQLALPVAGVNQAMELLGMDGFLQDEQSTMLEDAYQQVRNAFMAVGIPAEKVDSLASQMGQDTFVATSMLGGLYAAAPRLAATTGDTVARTFARQFGEFTQRFPGWTALSEIGATLGSRIGGDLGAQSGIPGAATGGPLVGALTGALAGTGLARAGKTALGTIGDLLPQAGRRAVTEAPLHTGTASSDDFAQFAAYALQQDRRMLDEEVMRVIDEVPMTDTTGEISAKFRERLEAAFKVGREREKGFWADVPSDTRSIPQNALNTLKEISREVDPASPAFPSALASRIRKYRDVAEEASAEGVPEAEPSLFSQLFGSPPAASQRPQRKIPFVKLQGLRSDTLEEARRARAGGFYRLERHLNQLGEALLRDMEEAAETSGMSPVALAQAREYSRHLHETFHRGPVGQILRVKRPGEPSTPDEQVMDQLTKRFEGIRQTRAIADEFDDPELVADMQRFIETEFAEAAAKGMFGAKGLEPGADIAAASAKARQFVAGKKKLIENLAAEGARVTQSFHRLNTLHQIRKDLEASALAKVVSRDGGEALSADAIAERIFKSDSPYAAARQLRRVAARDTSGAALRGLQNLMIEGLWRRAGARVEVSAGPLNVMQGSQGVVSPTNIRAALQRPGLHRALEHVLGEQPMNRLTEMVDMAVRIEKGDTRLIRRLKEGASTIFARVIGAQVGRNVAALTGGGTVQTPGITAGVMGRLVERYWAGPDAGDLLSAAVMDPKVYTILKSKVPQGVDQARVLANKMRRAIAAGQGLREAGEREAGIRQE